MKAENETQLAGDEALRMQKLIDVLESLDDVQEVYTSVVSAVHQGDPPSAACAYMKRQGGRQPVWRDRPEF
jgi:hypothetical protein